MFECPDFFELAGKQILLFSPQGIEPKGEQYQNLYQNGCLIGEFDYNSKKFTHGEFMELDKGFDFYAGQTFQDEKGRRILIGWMDMWESLMPEQEHGWAGALTIPRELKFNENGILSMVPIEELQKLRNEYIFVQEKTVSEKTILQQIQGDCLEIIAQFSLKECSAKKFGIHIRCSLDGQEKTSVIYNVIDGKIYVDRNYSGKGEGGIRTSVVHGNYDSIKLHLFIDRSSLELFVNNGETVMTSRNYPDPLSTSVELFSEGGVANLIQLESWTLKDIWR